MDLFLFYKCDKFNNLILNRPRVEIHTSRQCNGLFYFIWHLFQGFHRNLCIIWLSWFICSFICVQSKCVLAESGLKVGPKNPGVWTDLVLVVSPHWEQVWNVLGSHASCSNPPPRTHNYPLKTLCTV